MLSHGNMEAALPVPKWGVPMEGCVQCTVMYIWRLVQIRHAHTHTQLRYRVVWQQQLGAQLFLKLYSASIIPCLRYHSDVWVGG